jgi:hypothetical protein
LASMSRANTFGPKEEGAFANALDKAIRASEKSAASRPTSASS